MSLRKTLSHLVAATLAAALVATPAATAMPIDPTGPSKQQQDMHASTVHPPSAQQDLRGEAAAGDGTSASADGISASVVQDRRGEAAATGGTGAGTERGGPVRSPRVLPPPTWPENPAPLPRPAPVPVAVSGDSDDEIPVVWLALAGTFALAGGMALVATRHRGRTA
jgi:hypothetical protein